MRNIVEKKKEAIDSPLASDFEGRSVPLFAFISSFTVIVKII